MFPELDKAFDNAEIQKNCRHLWSSTGIYNFRPDDKGKVFSVDTPPPYVSAAHLHVGHAMSYTQAEILVRYKRMTGHNIFYPMGFDDNGLPTERYVEKVHKVNKKKISRSDFRQLCLDETQKGAKTYKELWESLGLSVDWDLSYSTIDPHCIKTSQKSFIDLYNKGLIQKDNEPVIWDVHFETSLAQADLDTTSRKGKMYDIAFADTEGNPLVISTTRPELITACVAMCFHPDDARYQHLKGKMAVVPLSGGRQVKMITDETVEMDFGTGLMQVSTFGDNEDVRKWKAHKLDTRMCIGTDGKMTDLAGDYAGLNIEEARSKIVKDLKEAGLVLKEQKVDQNVSVGERSGAPIEFAMEPQWFINVMDHKQEFMARAQQLEWFPDWMKTRLEHWIDGLKYNWNISRQRFYGVPFPVWYVEETGEVIVAEEADLPVDPTEQEPPAWAKEKFAGKTIVPETDVMDTWMTSSISPLINANWAESDGKKGHMGIYPMDLRVQAFEIIRTWLFYTLVKSNFHTNSLPWKQVMISGWGLNENGKKVSKSDLDKYTDENGYNRYDPYSLITQYGADALRYWAANSHLGKDLRFHERDVKDGRKTVVKLWNVARMSFMYLSPEEMNDDENKPKADPKITGAALKTFLSDAPAPADRPLEDRWILDKLATLTTKMTECFEVYDYATAKEALQKFFWSDYCDTYLELVKGRFWDADMWSDAERKAAQATLIESLRTLLGLFAPYLPYITEEIYQQAGKFGEDSLSLHVTTWPTAKKVAFSETTAMEIILATLRTVRQLRTDMKIGAASPLESLVLEAAAPVSSAQLEGLRKSLLSAARAGTLTFGTATGETSIEGLKVGITPAVNSEVA